MVELKSRFDGPLGTAGHVDDRRSECPPNRQNGEMPVPQRREVSHRHQCAAATVDPDRIDVRARLAFEDDER